jgi:glucose/arabinose dehydrogenase/PKD repeat protein
MHAFRPLFLLALAVCFSLLDAPALFAQTSLPDGFDDVHVASVPFPTAIAATPDGRLLIGSQGGQVFALAGDTLSGPILDLSARNCAYRERGLTGVAVDPGFAVNGYIYIAYIFDRFGNCDAEMDATPAGRVSRFVMAADGMVDPASEHVLIDNIPSPIGVHNLGDLKFGPDGNLYVGVGDGGCDFAGDSGCFDSNDAARSLNGLVGKILRIRPDGSIPPGNPFVGPDSVRCSVDGIAPAGKVCQEIFASGLRNPWRMAFDPNAIGVRFFINDVGQDTWEEVNEAVAGADYGWNSREGFCANSSSTDCSPIPPTGLTNPIFAYGRQDGCASITGGAFVPNGLWPSEYTGAYLFSDYVCGSIFILRRSEDGSYTRETLMGGLGESSATDLFFGPHQGGVALYYTTYAGGGELRRLSFVGSVNRAPVASLTASATFGPPPLAVDFSAAGSSDRDGDPLTFTWDFGDGSPVLPGGAAVRHTYATAGTYQATVTVTDPDGLSSSASLRIDVGNAPPQVTIVSPTPDHRFVVGEEIVLRGMATDPEDGVLPDAALSWRVILHHNTHTHGFLPSTAGNGVTFKAPGPENALAAATSHLAVELTATDSHGRTTVVYQPLMPRTVDVTFVGDPAGARLKVDLDDVVTPVTFRSWVNYGIAVDVPAQIGSDGTPLQFQAWSDGGPAARTIVTPASDATFQVTLGPAVPTLPGRIEAEAFGNGGPGVSFFDVSSINEGGAYRESGVDIEPTLDAGGGYNIGWVEPGEWLQYDLNVSAAGEYALRVRVASAGRGGTFHIEIGGIDRTGPLSIPDTGGWQNWTTVTAPIGQLAAGPQTWRLVIDALGPDSVVGNINYFEVVPAGTSGGAPYGGTAPQLPGRIEAENFDTGAAGTSFSDSTPGNLGGAYRTSDVDIEPSMDEDGGHGIGWAVAGEWTAYTVNVATAGFYDISVRVASAGAGGRFHLEANGANISGPLTVPDTSGWQIWQTVRVTRVSLAAGIQTWRLVMDADGSTGGVGNFNWILVAPSDPEGTTSPFNGTPIMVPGVLEAEHFDAGPQGSAYVDTTAGNAGGAFRAGDVDVEPVAGGAGYNVGWAGAGEWLQYSVQVQTAGIYELAFRVASEGPGGVFHLEVNGSDVTGPVAVPDSGGWQSWTVVRVPGVTLATGAQTWRLVLDSNGAHGGVGNFDAIEVSNAGISGPSAPEIVLYAADIPAQGIHGNWARVSDPSAAEGVSLASADRSGATVTVPAASPIDYVDVPFTAEAGVRYRLWIRMKAEGSSKFNDSIWVQFSGAVDTTTGSPRYRIGGATGLNVNQATCADCVPSGWGWQNRGYWESDTGEVQFAASGPQTLRIQIREDGVSIDQIVLSPSRFLTNPPGPAINDTTILSRQ